MKRLLPATLLLCASPAFAFPADAEWLAFRRASAPLSDAFGDRSGGSWAGLDVVGASAAPAGAWAADADRLYLRARVVGDPRNGGDAPPGDAAWAFLLDLDFDAEASGDAAWELQIAVGGPDAAVSVWENAGAPGVAIGLADISPVAGAWGDLDGGDVRFVEAGTAWHVEVAVSRAALRDLGLGDRTPFRVAVAAGLGTQLFDVAGCNGNVADCGALTPVLADAVRVDGDGDGLTTPFEASQGLNPDDADTDDDGIPDDEEPPGPSAAGRHPGADCDSDGDGVFDGTEVGLTEPHEHTNVDRGCFVPDADPDSTTDPMNPDTDGGGIPDGVEDLDGNGAVDADCWETDPTSAADDADTDGDGVADVLEAAGPDGEVDDEDSDGDGIPDAIEGTRDPDGDCNPAFLDLDSDDDGIPDAIEGGVDTDGDGLPDSADTDSDGDGRSDAFEGDEDIDCDGVIDRLDADDFDGFCDAPSVDTGLWEPPVRERPDAPEPGCGCATTGPAPP